MIFHHHQRNIHSIIPTLTINSETIEYVSEFNFLGLTIDEHLNWKPHIQKISNKIARTLGIMCRLTNFLPTHILRVLYNSLILPHLQYSILAWGFKMGRLDKLQKRTVRIITCSKYNSHTDPLFRKLNLLRTFSNWTYWNYFINIRRVFSHFIFQICFQILTNCMAIISELPTY